MDLQWLCLLPSLTSLSILLPASQSQPKRLLDSLNAHSAWPKEGLYHEVEASELLTWVFSGLLTLLPNHVFHAFKRVPSIVKSSGLRRPGSIPGLSRLVWDPPLESELSMCWSCLWQLRQTPSLPNLWPVLDPGCIGHTYSAGSKTQPFLQISAQKSFS